MSYMVFTKSSIYQNIQKIRIKLLGYLGKIFFLLLRIISKDRRSFFLYLVNAFSKLGSSKPVDFDSLTNCEHPDNKSEDDQQLTMSGKSKPNVIQTLSVEEGEWIKIKSSNLVLQKMQNLVQGFQARAENVKSRLTQPPTPSPTPPPADSTDSCESPKKGRPRLESLIQQEDVTATAKDYDEGHVTLGCCKMPTKYIPKFPTVLDPQSKLYISWLFFVMLSYVYNAWGIVLRAVFPYQAPDNLPIFLTFDYLSDIIYIIDLAFFKVRLQFLQDGFWVDDPEKTRKNYFRKAMFKMDVLSLLPLDLFYFIYGTNPLFRLPRLLKTQTFWEFFHRVDAVAKTPYVIRIIRTLLYMMYLIHLNACAYYAMSTWEGIGSNKWVFNGEGNAYIRCFYFATKTATSIGKNPKPENEYEYVFMTISWLMGVFIFAFLIGQIRDIVATATQSKTQYRQLMDQTVMYMRNLNLPDDLQRRVRLWLNHTWEQQKTLNEGGILDSLPRKMKTDVAINVHYNTLVKVQLFKDCDKALLRDLVLQLKPVLFLPGDYICRKGEVGKEMYIVNKGLVQVTDGENGEIILATLSEGSVFGEISLLGISGCSRRTADVRSQGFSNLFVLSKDDLWEALKNYPEAQKVLRKKAKLLIRENEARDRATKNNNIKKVAEPVIKHDVKKPSTPQMVRTVMQVVPKDSKCALMLMGKSRKSQSHNPLPAVECVSPKSKPLRHSSIAVIMKTKSAASLAKNRRFSPQPEKKDFIVECKERSSSAGTLKFMNYTQPAYESPNDQSPRDLAKIGIPDLPSTVQRHSVGGDESTAILNTIQAFIPRDSYYKKRRNTTQPEIQQQKDSSDVPKPNSSEDSGISVDSNHSRPHTLPARKSDDDLYSTEESGDSFSELSTICKQENATTNNDEQQSNEDNEQEEETIGRSWISPASSVLSLRSLFRTSSSSRSSGNKTETQYPHRDAGSDIFDLSGSVTSNSTSAGYENLAFVPVDLFSRRSSIFSDSSC